MFLDWYVPHVTGARLAGDAGRLRRSWGAGRIIARSWRAERGWVLLDFHSPEPPVAAASAKGHRPARHHRLPGPDGRAVRL